MTLPKGWRETQSRSNRPGSYRYEIRSPQRFRVGSLRTVPLEGVKGVKLIAGKLRPGDRELVRHGADSMVPQAVIFAKPDWPRFRDALEWQSSHFTRLENPPRHRGPYRMHIGYTTSGRDRWRYFDTLEDARRAADAVFQRTKVVLAIEETPGTKRLENPGIVDAIRMGDRVTIVDRFGVKHTGRAVMRSAHGGWVLNMGGKHGTPGIADESNIVGVKPANPRRLENQAGGPFKVGDRVQLHPATSQWMQGDRYGTVVRFGRVGKATIGGRPVYVKLDKSGRVLRFNPDNLIAIESLENPPPGSIPQIARAYNEGYNNGRIDKSLGHKSAYSFAQEPNDSLEHSDSGVRWRTAYGMGYRDGWNGAARRRDFGETRENPPRRLEDFRRGSTAAIEKLVAIDTEISQLFVQALELDSRGERMPEWMRDRIRGAQLERAAALEDVRKAIARHGAAIGEYSVPRSRRANPAGGGRAAAVRLYKEFHGVAPKGFTTKQIPELTQLVHLGRALRVDYEAARPRGPRGTPYRHEFAPGSELFTDRTGRALVILGNLKVSRAPRGRFGYIRAGA